MSDDKMNKVFSELQERANNISKYSDKLRSNLSELDSYLQRIGVGITVYDPLPFLLGKDEYDYEQLYNWHFNNDGLRIKKVERYEDEFSGLEFLDVTEAPRNVLVASVSRLVPFIKLIAESMVDYEKHLEENVDASSKVLECLKKHFDSSENKTVNTSKEGGQKHE